MRSASRIACAACPTTPCGALRSTGITPCQRRIRPSSGILISASLPEPVRARLLAKRDRRMTDDGVLVLNAQRFRTQERNREDARQRLAHFIETGLHAPKPRIATKPSRGAKERRLGEKRGRATIKQGRSGRNWD